MSLFCFILTTAVFELGASGDSLLFAAEHSSELLSLLVPLVLSTIHLNYVYLESVTGSFTTAKIIPYGSPTMSLKLKFVKKR